MWFGALLGLLALASTNAADCDLDAAPERMVNFSIPLGGLFPMRRSPAGLHREAVFRAAIDLLNEDALGCREVMTTGVTISPLVYSTSSLSVNSDEATGLAAAFDLVRPDDDAGKVVGIVGGASSDVSEIVQLVAKLHKTAQISYSATATTLSDKAQYPYFYRTCPPDNFQGQGIANVVQLLGWTSVAAIASSSTYGSTGIDTVISSLTAEGVEVAVSKQFASGADVTDQTTYDALKLALQAVADTKVHVIVCFADKNDINAVMTVAADLGLTGAGYVWFLPDAGAGSSDGFADVGTSSNTDLTGMLGMLPLRGSGDAYDAFLPDWYTRFNQPGYIQTGRDGTIQYNVSGPWDIAADDTDINPLYYDSWGNSTEMNSYAPYSFDATWAFGLAINQAINASVPVDLDDDNSLFLAAVNDNLKALSFEGLTGTVSFDENLDREGGYQVLQYQGGVWVDVGTWSPQAGLVWDNGGSSLQWNTGASGLGSIPPSVLPIVYEFRGVSDGAKGLGYFFLALGTLISAFFFTFQHQRRKHKYILLGTPPLNNMVLFGCVVAYVALVMAGVETPDVCEDGDLDCTSDDGVCHARFWLMPLGFTLIFGPLFAKTYRVNRVFNNKKLKQVRITAMMLMRYVAGLLLADVLVLVIWSSVDNAEMVTHLLPLEVNPDQPDQFLQPYNVACESDNMGVFVGYFLVCKGLLLLAGAILAYETRNVQIAACNDSSSIGVAIHTLLVIGVIVVPVLFMVNDDPDTEYIVLSVSMFMATTVVQSVIFMPKVLAFKNNTADLDAEIKSSNNTTDAGAGSGSSRDRPRAPAPAPAPAAQSLPVPATNPAFAPTRTVPTPLASEDRPPGTPGRETHNPAFTSVTDNKL